METSVIHSQITPFLINWLFFPKNDYIFHTAFHVCNPKCIIISVDGIETIRWPVTMCFLGVCSLFCLLLFIGAIIHSRGTLIVFSVCGLFSIIVLWLLAAIYITLAVAIAGIQFFYYGEGVGILPLGQGFHSGISLKTFKLCND